MRLLCFVFVLCVFHSSAASQDLPPSYLAVISNFGSLYSPYEWKPEIAMEVRSYLGDSLTRAVMRCSHEAE